ncbi:cupin domain-containing protein [Streptomyces sp. SID12501]|uniref:Cupin domain-containing protein n=1 Tax=Streptomyces sp. SID12501 TaxID=2706042 RepID=A0A6B3BQ07_9ACTN|nr:cupin domain-containing protein [Streptomyces sp. SID12501]NEC86424.1 cupin domain-containing protein [Streptomyces sp. SID12501]
MPFIRSTEAVAHEIHGGRFVSYVRPDTGSRDLAAWRTEVPAGMVGPAHTISHEETFYVLSGRLRLTIGGESAELGVGDAAVASAGSELADGSTITPPWAR